MVGLMEYTELLPISSLWQRVFRSGCLLRTSNYGSKIVNSFFRIMNRVLEDKGNKEMPMTMTFLSTIDEKTDVTV